MRIRQRQVICADDKDLTSLPTLQAPDALDEVVQCIPRLTWVDRQRDQSLGYILGNRELAFAKPALLKSCSVMQGRVVSAQLDSLFGEHGIDEIVLLPAKLFGIYLDGIKVENVLAAGTDRREFYARHISKPRGNVSRIINATLIERIEFPQLDYTYRTLDIGQAEIVAAVIEVLPPEP